MTGEITNNYAKVTLLPIMIGLALCSSFELNFSLFGFLAAVITNITEW
jgi:solute carrier family 35, member E2